MRSRLFRPTLDALDARIVPAIYTVDDSGGADFTTIQAAVDKAATTTANDTVRVRPGTYTEQVTITEDDLILRAVGTSSKNPAVIQAPAGLDPFSILVKVSGDDVVVDGFTVTGPAAGLDVGIGVGGGAEGVVIRNNLVTNIGTSPLGGSQTSAAILITGAQADVLNNTVREYEKGGIVVVDDETDGSAFIKGNTVVGSGPTGRNAQNGIQVSDGAEAVVTGNTVSGNTFTPDGTEAAGILVQAAGRVTVADNRLDANEVGVLVEDQVAGLLVSGNRVTNSGSEGISLTDSRRAVVRDNTVAGVGDSPISGGQIGLGILLDGSDATVSGNRVSKYQKAGIVAFGPGTVTIRDNTVTGAGPTAVIAQNGIQVSDGVDAVVSGNTVSRNVFTPGGTEAAGILVFMAGQVTVADNELERNEVGVLVEDQTAGLLVFANDIDDSTLDGISLTNSRGAVIKANDVDDSGRDGIRLTDTEFAAVLANEVDDSGRYGIALTGTSRFNLVALNRVDDSDVRDYFQGPNATANLFFANR